MGEVKRKIVNGAHGGGGGKGEKGELYLGVAFCMCNSLFERFFRSLRSVKMTEAREVKMTVGVGVGRGKEKNSERCARRWRW
ncbi:MAG: hypothetical protein IJ706_08660 [Clostridia bacterium]|nr:hypothetical protein [Clostridia bacterium]